MVVVDYEGAFGKPHCREDEVPAEEGELGCASQLGFNRTLVLGRGRTFGEVSLS